MSEVPEKWQRTIEVLAKWAATQPIHVAGEVAYFFGKVASMGRRVSPEQRRQMRELVVELTDLDEHTFARVNKRLDEIDGKGGIEL